MIRTILLAVVLCLCAGCAPAITSGELTNKTFTPAHDDTTCTFNPMTNSVDWSTDHVPDRWTVTFRRMNEKTNEWQYRTISVTKEYYDSVNSGDFVEFQ
jgi:hypothetical protein